MGVKREVGAQGREAMGRSKVKRPAPYRHERRCEPPSVAVKHGYIERNVATLVDLPALVKKERTVLTPQEARQFIKAAEG